VNGTVSEKKTTGAKEKIQLIESNFPSALFLTPRNWNDTESIFRVNVNEINSLFTAFNIVQAHNPLNLSNAYHRFYSYQEQNNWRHAKHLAGKLLELDINHTLTSQQRHDLYLSIFQYSTHTGQTIEVNLAEFHNTLEENPDWLETRVYIKGLCHTLIDSCDNLKSEESLERFTQYDSKLQLRGNIKIHWQGTHALLLLYAGRFKDAIDKREKNLALAKQVNDREVPRCLTDLGEAYRRFGRFKKARDTFDQGIEMIEAFPDDDVAALYYKQTKGFAKLYRSRVLTELDEETLAQKDREDCYHIDFEWVHALAQLDAANNQKNIDDCMKEIYRIDRVDDPQNAWLIHKAWEYRQLHHIGVDVTVKLQELTEEWKELDIDEIIRRIPY